MTGYLVKQTIKFYDGDIETCDLFIEMDREQAQRDVEKIRERRDGLGVYTLDAHIVEVEIYGLERLRDHE